MRLGKRKEEPSGQEQPQPNPFAVAVSGFNDVLLGTFNPPTLETAFSNVLLHATDGVQKGDVMETARRYSMVSLLSRQASEQFAKHQYTETAGYYAQKAQELDDVSHFLQNPSEATKIPEAPQMSEPKR